MLKKKLKSSQILIAILMLLLSCTKISFSSFRNNIAVNSNTFKPVVDKLLERGADTNFVNFLLSLPKTKFSDRYVKVNVTGYLSTTDYSHNYNTLSVNRTKQFIAKHRNQLEAAQKRFGVEIQFIAAILWVETRHGGYLGNNHIPSVYLSTALASEEKYIELNIIEMDKKFAGNRKEREKLVERIRTRSKSKSDWAINQLLALEAIKDKLPYSLDSLFGSWAGAFGMSQFLPSSYKSWAVDGNSDGIIDLFNVDDAIFSVANYLKSNGWGTSMEDKRKAIFHYNNSRAYVDAVVKLAELSIK